VRSTILTSQLPVSRWHEQIGDPTLADGTWRPMSNINGQPGRCSTAHWAGRLPQTLALADIAHERTMPPAASSGRRTCLPSFEARSHGEVF
jgi:hypothetical protein